MWNRTLPTLCCATIFSAANFLNAQDLTVVSAAGTQSLVAPGSLASVYGQFSATPTIGVLNTLGLFPTQLSGMALDFNGVNAQLLYVGPDQINFLVPSGSQFGSTKLNVMTSGNARSTSATVQPVAPAIFTTIRNGREIGAILNAVTFQADPFPLQTPEIPGCDSRTRLALYATGLGLATQRAKPRDVQVVLTDAAGTTFNADVDAAVAAPGYAGLDQVNFTLPSDLHPGTVRVRLVVNGVSSNETQFDVTTSIAAPGSGACLGSVVVARATSPSAAPYQGMVTLAYPAMEGGVTVNLLGEDGITVPATVNIPSGQRSATFPISASTGRMVRVAAVLNGDARLGSFDGTGAACVNGLSLSSDGIVAGNSLRGTVMLTDPAPAGGATVNLASNSPLVSLSQSVNVAAGQMSAPFDISTAAVVVPSRATLIAAGSCGGTATGLNLVLMPCVSGVSLSTASIAGGGKITGTVKLTAPALAGGVLVNLATNSPSVTSDTSVRVEEGQTTATFTLNANAVSARTLAAITASVANCGSVSTTLALMPM
jgi:uncharacterized protein (TIGR03437 family)